MTGGNQIANQIVQEVGRVVKGKEESIALIMTAILAGGHVLIEDIPGVGKTTLALAFSKAMQLSHSRVQFTPDVLPSDVTGFSVYDRNIGEFVYQPGAAMCNVLLADEINRTSPKTQSALLEVMEEGNVTIDGVTREVPKPFFVMATQNPLGSAGTQRLPESQVDRFMICITMGYPDEQSEIEILKGTAGEKAVQSVRTIAGRDDIAAMQAQVQQIYIKDILYAYMVRLAAATRSHPQIELGISPRGTIALCRMAKGCAYLQGRDYVIPDDIYSVITAVMNHRIKLKAEAQAGAVAVDDIIMDIVHKVPRPSIQSAKPR